MASEESEPTTEGEVVVDPEGEPTTEGEVVADPEGETEVIESYVLFPSRKSATNGIYYFHLLFMPFLLYYRLIMIVQRRPVAFRSDIVVRPSQMSSDL